MECCKQVPEAAGGCPAASPGSSDPCPVTWRCMFLSANPTPRSPRAWRSACPGFVSVGAVCPSQAPPWPDFRATCQLPLPHGPHTPLSPTLPSLNGIWLVPSTALHPALTSSPSCRPQTGPDRRSWLSVHGAPPSRPGVWAPAAAAVRKEFHESHWGTAVGVAASQRVSVPSETSAWPSGPLLDVSHPFPSAVSWTFRLSDLCASPVAPSLSWPALRSQQVQCGEWKGLRQGVLSPSSLAPQQLGIRGLTAAPATIQSKLARMVLPSVWKLGDSGSFRPTAVPPVPWGPSLEPSAPRQVRERQCGGSHEAAHGLGWKSPPPEVGVHSLASGLLTRRRLGNGVSFKSQACGSLPVLPSTSSLSGLRSPRHRREGEHQECSAAS